MSTTNELTSGLPIPARDGIEVERRRPWRLTLARFLRDRWSVAAAVALGVILVATFAGGAIVGAIVGHNGTDLFPYAINGNLKAVGPWTHVPALANARGDEYGDILPAPRGTPTTLFVLGADGPLGRDELIRLLDGGRTSLEIGLGAVLFALLVALPLGCVAGFFGGIVDAVVSRVTETIMAFPLILFLVFASVRLRDTLNPIGWSWVLPRGVFAVALLIGVFTSFYPLRLIRAELFGLREAEFVQAEHMIGASNWRILSRHLLPHLLPTLLVWSAIAVATNILLEVGLSFVGAGVQASTPTWGSLLSTTWGTIYQPTPFNGESFTVWQTIFPSLAIFITVVALNQLSEGIRRALDPGSRR